MRPCRRAWLAVALLLAAGRAAADVCVAVSGGEHAAAASAARSALGVPSRRIDVRDERQRSQLASRCGRLVIAVGPEALRAAVEDAPRSPVVRVMTPGDGARAWPGVSLEPDPRLVLETFRKIAPRARRIGAVYDPGATGELVARAQAAGRALGMEILALPVRTVGEAIRAFHRFEKEIQVDALWLLPDGTATVRETVYYALELAHWRRMAVIGLSPWYVASGALFALVPRPEASGAAAGELARRVLEGEVPDGEVHVRDCALYVNQRAAARLGLKIPREILDSAEQILP